MTSRGRDNDGVAVLEVVDDANVVSPTNVDGDDNGGEEEEEEARRRGRRRRWSGRRRKRDVIVTITRGG